MKAIRALMTFAGLAVGTLGHASEGAFEINQACADVGCFPGDAPGFPVLITMPGKYILTSNLTVSAANVAAISLGVSNIDLDLRGFSVIGPAQCSGAPVSCSVTNGSNGIDGNGITRGSQVSNGYVRGFNWGIATDHGWRLTNVVSESNSSLGFFIRKGTIARDCAARFNALHGFQIGALGTVMNSVASNNATGMSTYDSDASGGGVGGATIEQVVVFDNGTGIDDHGRSRISNSAIYSNASYGVVVNNGGTIVSGNRIMDNGSHGLQLSGGVAFGASGQPTGLVGNIITNNNGHPYLNQIGGGGARYSLGPNVCGSAASCP